MIRKIILQGLLAAAIIGGGAALYATWASDGLSVENPAAARIGEDDRDDD